MTSKIQPDSEGLEQPKLNHKQIWRLVLDQIKPWPQYWWWMALRLVYIVAEILSPIFLGLFIDQLNKNQFQSNQTYLWLGITISIMVLGPSLEVFTSKKAWVIAAKASRYFRYNLIKNFEFVPLSFWAQNSQGKIFKIINSSVDAISLLVASISWTYLWIVARLVGIILAASYLNLWATLVLIINFIFYIAILTIITKFEVLNIDKEQKAEENVSGSINQFLTNFRTIVYLNLFQKQSDEIQELNHKSYLAYKKREDLSMLGWTIVGTMGGLSLAAILVIGLWQIQLGLLTVGGLSSILLFLNTYTNTSAWLLTNLKDYNRYATLLNRYLTTFKDIQPVQNTKQNKIQSFQTLELKNTSLIREGRETVRNLGLKIQAGQKVALVGFTGSGKSTLLDLILKVQKPSSGSILINGLDYAKLEVSDLISIFSIVPQSVQLFKGSIRENIEIQKTLSQAEIDKLLEICQLQDLIKKLPSGVDSDIQESGHNFSGGEKQRIGIARALAQNQEILILDEATASLDPKTERNLIEAILHKFDKTLIYVTHKYSLLNHFDLICVLNEGEVVQIGSFIELSQKEGLFRDLYKASLNH